MAMPQAGEAEQEVIAHGTEAPTDADRQRIAMLLHGSYPLDERVKREAEALADCGYEVDVICLREHPEEEPETVINGVRAVRVSKQRTRSDSKRKYVMDYAASVTALGARLAMLHARHRYDLVQVHTLPDFLVFSALPAKLTGARVVLDIHDLMPELYLSKFSLPGDGRVVRMLRTLERMSTTFADHVITASEAFQERLVESGVPSEKITVVLNSPDPSVFPSPPALRLPGQGERFTVFWHGTMVDRYGVDLALRACALARERVPGLRFVLYGIGERSDDLRALATELGLDSFVEFRGHLHHTELAPEIAKADVGIVPNRPDRHIDMAYPSKLFEFVQMGIPVVATRTKILERRFGEDSVVFCAPDASGLADGLVWVYEHPVEARDRLARMRVICEPIAWERVRLAYTGCIAATIGRPAPSLAGTGAHSATRQESPAG